MRPLVLALVLAACGDNAMPEIAGLAAAHDLAIVAHQDDDLLFMQPDLIDAVRAGTGVTIVYVTAGNDDRDLAYSQQRYAGVRAAYAAVARTDAAAWRCGWFELAGHTAEQCRLDAANLALVFLGYPDGGRHGEFASSLLALWQGRITGADTLAERTAHYDREGLIATLAAAITATRPRTIRTLEVAGTHGDDHSDHMFVGALAVLARARAGGDAELLAYRGYDIKDEPANDVAPITTIADDAFARYSACAEGCAACGEACSKFSPTYATYLQRHYAVRVNRIVTGSVAGAMWRFDGTYAHVGDGCVAVGDDGAVTTADCSAATPLVLDEEGHIWVGTPPATGTDLDHLDCLALVAGVPHAQLCGGDGDGAAVWSVLPPTVTTSMLTVLLSGARPTRLADFTGDGIADLCFDDGIDLLCAAGDGTGSFAPTAAVAELAIEPVSLAIGVFAGKLDACGVDAQGIRCANGGSLAAPVGANAASLAIRGGEVCGLGASGAVCMTPAGVRVLSPWPPPDADLWFADLDGDRSTDWCVATPDGPACGRAADAQLFTNGVPWAYSLAGVRDTSPASAGTGALADIDGDGRADWCTLDATRVTCAFSHGSAFGPRVPVMELPTAPEALWADDSGALCVDMIGAVTCRALAGRAPTVR